MNNIGEKLELVDPNNIIKSNDKQVHTAGLKDVFANTELTEEMEKEMASAIHYLYPVVKTEVTEEDNDHMLNRNKDIEREDFQPQVGEVKTPKEKEGSKTI